MIMKSYEYMYTETNKAGYMKTTFISKEMYLSNKDYYDKHQPLEHVTSRSQIPFVKENNQHYNPKFDRNSKHTFSTYR